MSTCGGESGEDEEGGGRRLEQGGSRQRQPRRPLDLGVWTPRVRTRAPPRALQAWESGHRQHGHTMQRPRGPASKLPESGCQDLPGGRPGPSCPTPSQVGKTPGVEVSEQGTWLGHPKAVLAAGRG